MTVSELDQRMSSEEYSNWVAFYELEPFGPYRDNLHAGIIASILANIHRAKGSQAMKATDYLLVHPDDRRDKDTRKTLNLMRMVAKRG